jgi:hypothetical protein
MAAPPPTPTIVPVPVPAPVPVPQLQAPPARVSAVTDAALLEPFHYLCAHPGKNVRSQLIEAFNHWLRVPAPRLAVIKDAVEMLHTASLLCAGGRDVRPLSFYRSDPSTARWGPRTQH